MRLTVAREDPALIAELRDLRELRYGRAADGLPAHVRAASGVRRAGARLLVVQDDVHAIATLDLAGEVGAVRLPSEEGSWTFEEASGTKHLKMDLEACVTLPDGRFVAFGSGSTAARERIVVLDGDALRVVDGAALYARLRAEHRFSGSELNVEGAVVTRDTLRLFQRSNGAPRDGREPTDATVDLGVRDLVAWLDGGPAPELGALVRYDLGAVDGARFGFTDAAALDADRVAFVACAEASPDTYRDGEVRGCRFGIIGPEGARVTDVRGEDGRPTALKIEGIERAEDGSFHVVIDVDRADLPARIGRLVVHDSRDS